MSGKILSGQNTGDEDTRANSMYRASKNEFSKGQLISKYPYEKSVSSKIPTKIFLEFCPEMFCSFLGAS